MSTSAGLLMPRGPFSGAAPLALRPLSAIAASAAGGVPETRIKRLLSDLLPSLIALHAQGEICGDISLDTVGMDEGARAHLLPELVVVRSRRASRTPTPGFAPFELHTDAIEWPRGPWSDIYALCAVAHALVTGRRPPPAPERRIIDSYKPLASLGLAKYSQEFLNVIDSGLSMSHQDRPQTVAALAGLLGIEAYVEPSETAIDSGEGVAYAAQAARRVDAERPARRRLPLRTLFLIVALIGAGTYAWFQLGMGAPNALIARSEVVQPNPPVVHPLPQVVSPAGSRPTPTSTEPRELPSLNQSAAAATPDGPIAAVSPTEPVEVSTAIEDAPKPKPAPVAVRLDIRPWGEVWINGVARGVSPPVKELKLAPGKYQVVLRNADLPPYRATLDVRAGKSLVISHSFQ